MPSEFKRIKLEMNMWPLGLCFLVAGLGVVYAIGCALWVLRQPLGSQALRAPYLAIREGAAAFLKVQYGTVAAVGVAIFALLWSTPKFGLSTALGFALGGRVRRPPASWA